MNEQRGFWKDDVYPRLAPMLALLDTRYMPVLFSATWQSYTIYLYLWAHSDQSATAHAFAKMGGLAFESLYIGAIAWAYLGQSNAWSRMTAFVALVFSVAIAVYMHRAEGSAAWLQSGFSIATYCYTMQMHNARAPWWVTWLFGDDERPVSPVAQVISTLPSASGIKRPAKDSVALPASTSEPSLDDLLAKMSKTRQEMLAILDRFGMMNTEAKYVYAALKRNDALPEGITVERFAVLLEELKADSKPVAAPVKKQPTRKSKPANGITKRSRVRSTLDEHGSIKDSELYGLLPDISQSSIRVHASEWRKEQLQAATNGQH